MGKKAKKDTDTIKHTQSCKHCGTQIKHVKVLPNKRINEKFTFWGAIEYSNLKIFKVTCSNPECKKKYTVRLVRPSWQYK